MHALTTELRAPFAGQLRTFELRIDEIGLLERRCEAGIGEIYLRLCSARFKHADIRETILLGRIGGGASEPEATAEIMAFVDRAPLASHLQLAVDILAALLNGTQQEAPGKLPAEGNDAPATSPPSTPPAV